MKKKKTNPGQDQAPGSGLIPCVHREVRHLLSSEEAKISAGGLVKGAVAMLTIGIAVDALAGHYNQHASFAPHASLAPHHSVDCGHDNVAVHQDAYPHVSVNEAVTKGTFHNNVADGFGKHTANVSHNNNPNVHTNTSGHTNNAPHYHYWAHASTAPHVNVGHHGNYAPHYSRAPHHSMHNSNGSY